MADVGRAAGVSVCTVSRAFSMPDTVRPAIREQIFAAAERLNYVPNSSAKALRLQRTHLFGAVIPTLDHAYFAKLVNSFQETLAASGYVVVVLTTGFNNYSMFDRVRALIEQGAEALMVVGRIEDEALRKYIAKRRIPIVTTYTYLGEGDFPSVGFDNYASTRNAIDYITRLGHTRLAMIAGPMKGNDRQTARVKAFKDAHEELGISEPWPVLERDYVSAISKGAECLRLIHAAHPDTTAIICNSDAFALGILLEAQRLGLKVPQDFSLIGHDDQEFAGLILPGLTTIRVPAEEMGRWSAEALLNAKQHDAPVMPMKLDADLIIRGSTAPPKAT